MNFGVSEILFATSKLHYFSYFNLAGITKHHKRRLPIFREISRKERARVTALAKLRSYNSSQQTPLSHQ